MDRTVPKGAAFSRVDNYHVYRPLLDLIGFTEGTDKGRGYNETLAYGKMLDGEVTKGKGPTVELVAMPSRNWTRSRRRCCRIPTTRS